MICGGLTGALYKSTLGFTPMCVGATLGIVGIGGLTTVTDFLY